MALLDATGVAKNYGGVAALRSASFELLPGEVHALVGENGAGKSTLIKVFTGAVQPDSGTVRVKGEAVPAMTPTLSRSLGIAAIYQQPSLFPQLSVAENIALALEPVAGLRRVDWAARRQIARGLLDQVGAAIHPDLEAYKLSLPEQQLVEMAKALGASAGIFIMDEPTASLSDREVDRLFTVIGGLRERGAGIIYISHRLDELPRIADRVTVLRDGQTIATHNARELDKPAIIRLMVGRDVSAVFPKREVAIGGTLLELRGFCGVDLSVRAGEILGLAGLVGAGRTELARAIFGLQPSAAGEIFVRGRAVRIDSPETAIRNGIAYVPEDRRRHGLIEAMTIAENTTLATLRSVSRYGLIDFSRERRFAADYAVRLGTKTPGVDVAANTLSGGNQQKVVLSRWLATSPSVLILDEPTQGIDVGAKAEVHRLMTDMAAQGMAILMISSELPEILGMSDRIAVMARGRITGVLDRAGATQEKILAMALPGAAA
jgi:rhamnose transport system ATP-binding protein